MKIAILTSGILPIPAVQGGAVENLIDYYLGFNNIHRMHDITVFSVWHPDVANDPALKSDVNHYIYIKTTGWWAKIKKKIYEKTHHGEYYNYTIEYFFTQALKHIKKQEYDIIILENRPGYTLKLKGKTTAKIFYHLHNDLLNKQSKNAGELYKEASGIVTVSRYITNRVRTINTTDTKCVTVHNGIDIKTFTADGVVAQIPGISNDDFIIVFSGRINNEKGIMELISAMNLISRNHHIKLLVLGSSFYANANNNNPFAKRLIEIAEPIKDNIIFTGYIPYNDVPKFLRLANIAVLPSTWDEPFGLTIAEAQAMGLPIITTRRGGIPEVVTEENAILLNTDNHFVEHLAEAILFLYNHPEKRKRMSEASLNRSKLFDKEIYAKNFFAALKIIETP